MVALSDALCLLLSPRAEDAKGSVAHRLREAGVHLWNWPLSGDESTHPSPPDAFDALLVLDAPAASAVPPAWVALLRQAWQKGATIGLFGSGVDLLAAAEIGSGAGPIETPGVFVDREAPAAGTLDEFVDALRAGPHLDR